MLAHQRSRDTLTSGSLFKAENNRIASVSLNLQTVTSTKSLLSASDDKRYILDDGQHTFLYGHKKTSWVKLRLALMVAMTTPPLHVLAQLMLTIWKNGCPRFFGRENFCCSLISNLEKP